MKRDGEYNRLGRWGTEWGLHLSMRVGTRTAVLASLHGETHPVKVGYEEDMAVLVPSLHITGNKAHVKARNGLKWHVLKPRKIGEIDVCGRHSKMLMQHMQKTAINYVLRLNG